MINVTRFSPVYKAVQYTGSITSLATEFEQEGIDARVTPHTRLGHAESMYAMIEFAGSDQPIFVHEGEWILFNSLTMTYSATANSSTFHHNFKEV